MKQLIARVTNSTKIADDIYKLEFTQLEIAEKAIPGQFVSILCKDLVLRRPFSISNVKNDTIEVIYKVKGKGTEYLQNLQRNSEIDLIGPLGNGFNITQEKALLLGAGVGAAPMIFLSYELAKHSIPFVMLSGFQEMVYINDLNKANCYMATEDGSSGLKGSVNDHLEKMIIENGIKKIYTCGPSVVMKFASELAAKLNINIETALEREFACGTGVCMGCVIKIMQNGEAVNKRICKDGPVFNGKEVIWQ